MTIVLTLGYFADIKLKINWENTPGFNFNQRVVSEVKIEDLFISMLS